MVAADFKFGKNFGRLAAEKNLYLAVDAFLAMRAVNPRTRLVLVGIAGSAGGYSRPAVPEWVHRRGL